MEKRFYWIKLKTDFFNQDTIDFLMSQKNGSEYVVLYQMLCLQTANNNGNLATQIGEILVPYDVPKIVRDTKYFTIDTVTVALELFKRLGLIFVEDEKILRITGIDEMVGSEGSSAKRVREHRARKALQCNTEVTQEIEYRDKSIEIDADKEKKEREISDMVAQWHFSGAKVKALDEYIKMRRLIKKPLTYHALELVVKKLETMGDEETQIAILEQSIANSWQGIFPLKGEEKKNNGCHIAHIADAYDKDFNEDGSFKW